MQDQRIHAIRVIARQRLDHRVAVTFIERQCGKIIDRGFQLDQTATGSAQAFFRAVQQQRSNAMTPSSGYNIDRDDVTNSTFDLSNDEPGNAAIGVRVVRRSAGRMIRSRSTPGSFLRIFVLPRGAQGYQAKRRLPPEVNLQLGPRIRDSRRKTFLVNPPKGVEIGGLEVTDLEISDREWHILILAANSS